MAKYRFQRSESEWLQLISECRQSGLADNAWCEHNDINVSTFYNTVTRLRKKACGIPQPAKTTCDLDLTSSQDVVPIEIYPDLYPKTKALANPFLYLLYYPFRVFIVREFPFGIKV